MGMEIRTLLFLAVPVTCRVSGFGFRGFVGAVFLSLLLRTAAPACINQITLHVVPVNQSINQTIKSHQSIKSHRPINHIKTHL